MGGGIKNSEIKQSINWLPKVSLVYGKKEKTPYYIVTYLYKHTELKGWSPTITLWLLIRRADV